MKRVTIINTIGLIFALLLSVTVQAVELPDISNVQQQLDSAKSSGADAQQVQDLEETINFLKQIENQKKQILTLKEQVSQAETRNSQSWVGTKEACVTCVKLA